jgi:hypothetical protein
MILKISFEELLHEQKMLLTELLTQPLELMILLKIRLIELFPEFENGFEIHGII